MNCKRLLCALLVLLMLALCVGCGGTAPDPDNSGDSGDPGDSGDSGDHGNTNSYTVTFVFGEGFSDRTASVNEGSTVTPPVAPPWIGHGVTNWYRDEGLTARWDIENDQVTENITLYAEWGDAEITIAQALELCTDEDGYRTESRYLVRGTVESIVNPTYGQMVITDGTDSISVYGTYSDDGELRYPDVEDKPYAGDEVLLYAILQNHGGNKEIYSGWILEVKHDNSPVDDTGYTAMSVADAREAASETLISVQGVVTRITYATGKVPSGFILADDTGSIYVYDAQIAPRVAIGNTVTVLGEKTYWILDSEKENAALFGYGGCCQLQNAKLKDNDGLTTGTYNSDWVQNTTVKELLETPFTGNVTTQIYRVTALVQKKPGDGFINYYLYDLDGTTGSYVYTQCNGADFAWLDAFDGKFCTVDAVILNAKSTASGCAWRLLPVRVADDGFTFDPADAGKFAVEYHGIPQFLTAYTGDPALQLCTRVDSDLLGFTGAVLSYSSNNEDVIYFDGEIMHTKNAGTATVTVTGQYGSYAAYSRDITVTVEAAGEVESIGVAQATASELGSTLSVKGIVGPSLVNQTGFYLIDESGILAVRTTKEEMSKLAIGYEVVMEGTLSAVRSGADWYGQMCLDTSTIKANYYGKHDYSTASFKSDKTLTELAALPVTENHSAEAYIVEASITVESKGFSTNYYLVEGETKMLLYAGSGAQYAWLNQFEGTVTMEIALINWNGKTYQRACVLAVYLEDGTKVVNSLNFS